MFEERRDQLEGGHCAGPAPGSELAARTPAGAGPAGTGPAQAGQPTQDQPTQDQPTQDQTSREQSRGSRRESGGSRAQCWLAEVTAGVRRVRELEASLAAPEALAAGFTHRVRGAVGSGFAGGGTSTGWPPGRTWLISPPMRGPAS